ncbi:MAG: hypothetical protein PF518_18870 [Spirochaetaceae bacterium]|jgi:hypothetical protein|nr:hypothetical protein [Spirochaetaceae bacterium]
MELKFKIIVVLLLSVFVTSCASAKGAFDNNKVEDIITLTGRIKIKGSEPMTFVTLVAEDGNDYVLTGEMAENLGSNHQLRLIEIKGRVIAHGEFPRPTEVEVLNFKILK